MDDPKALASRRKRRAWLNLLKYGLVGAAIVLVIGHFFAGRMAAQLHAAFGVSVLFLILTPIVIPLAWLNERFSLKPSPPKIDATPLLAAGLVQESDTVSGKGRNVILIGELGPRKAEVTLTRGGDDEDMSLSVSVSAASRLDLAILHPTNVLTKPLEFSVEEMAEVKHPSITHFQVFANPKSAGLDLLLQIEDLNLDKWLRHVEDDWLLGLCSIRVDENSVEAVFDDWSMRTKEHLSPDRQLAEILAVLVTLADAAEKAGAPPPLT